MKNPLDDLTICVTNFRRPDFLTRCLKSVKVAGCRRVVVASVEPDPKTKNVIEGFRRDGGWLSFDIAYVDDDIGCNDTWQLAAYHARTKRIIILHDDDTLNAAFGKTYAELIAPMLDKNSDAFSTWRADLLFMNNTHEATDFWSGPTRMLPSKELLSVVAARQRLSLSPIISVFDRETVIHACKEAKDCLVHPDCYERPGMLLGTEIVVYMRHIQKYPKWLYVDKVLSHYGSHAGSGTVRAQQDGHMYKLWNGYDKAREQAERPAPQPSPRILLVSNPYTSMDQDELRRGTVARRTWAYHFGQSEMIDMPVRSSDLPRDSSLVGDPRKVPFVRDVFNWGCARAMSEDIIAYVNRDIGLSADAPELIWNGIQTGRGVTCCPRRRLVGKPGRMYKGLLNCWPDGGFDVFAFTPAWWFYNREKFPDMLIGREAWDTVFRQIAEEWADDKHHTTGHAITHEQWGKSLAYTDQVCWHENHMSHWIKERLTSPGQLHNRKLAKEFFISRNNVDLVKSLT